MLHRPVAAFRIVPYYERRKLDRPPLDDELDISTVRLREMEESEDLDPEVTAVGRALDEVTGARL